MIDNQSIFIVEMDYLVGFELTDDECIQFHRNCMDRYGRMAPPKFLPNLKNKIDWKTYKMSESAFETLKRYYEDRYDDVSRFNLGILFCVNKQIDLTMAYMTELAQDGYAPAQVYLGRVYYDRGEYNIGLKWYLLAAEQDYPRVYFNLARSYDEGLGIEKNYKKAFEYFQLGAKYGDLNCCGFVGWCYYCGFGVDRDYHLAYKWCKSVSEESMGACYILGFLYKHGRGIPKDLEQSMLYFKKSGDLGVYQVGLIHKRNKEYELAFKCFERGSNEGDVESHKELGLLYHKGLGVIRDYERAMFLYEKAACAGNINALVKI